MVEPSPGDSAARDPSPVFVTGVPRSGTTLLAMVLGTHSLLSIAPETHYFDKFHRKGQRRGCLESGSRFARFVDYFLESPELEAYGFTDDDRDGLRREILSEPERSHRIVLQAVLRRYAERLGKPLYGEKTPKHMHHIDTLFELFPRSHVIHVVRDPRDVVLSLREVGWEPGNLLRHLDQWERSAAYVERYSREAPDRFLAIRYEDLLLEPQDTIVGMCRFLGIEFEPAMLRPEATTPNFDVRTEPWKAAALEPIDPRRTGGWKARMEDTERRVVEARLAAPMADLGYSTSTTGTFGVRTRLAYLHLQNAWLLGRHWLRRARARLRASY